MFGSGASSAQALCSMRKLKDALQYVLARWGSSGTKRRRSWCLLEGCAAQISAAVLLFSLPSLPPLPPPPSPPSPLPPSLPFPCLPQDDATAHCTSAMCAVSPECIGYGQQRAFHPVCLTAPTGLWLACTTLRDSCVWKGHLQGGLLLAGLGRPQFWLREQACALRLPKLHHQQRPSCPCCVGYGQPAEGLPPGAEQPVC